MQKIFLVTPAKAKLSRHTWDNTYPAWHVAAKSQAQAYYCAKEGEWAEGGKTVGIVEAWKPTVKQWLQIDGSFRAEPQYKAAL